MTAATTPQLDAPTTALEPIDEPIVDSFPLLDHRARRRAIPRALAPAGRYLAFGDQLIRLESRLTHLGRSGACEIRFEDQRVSRDHAILCRLGRYVRVLDNRSANGTFVNGRRIVATNLSDGDEIRLGPLAMRYVEIA
jgi:hypothetical protein